MKTLARAPFTLSLSALVGLGLTGCATSAPARSAPRISAPPAPARAASRAATPPAPLSFPLQTSNVPVAQPATPPVPPSGNVYELSRTSGVPVGTDAPPAAADDVIKIAAANPPKKSHEAELPDVFDRFKNGAALVQMPKPPLWLKGCELSCCAALNSKKVKDATDLHAKPADDSEVIKTLAPDTVVKRAAAYMKVVKFGSGAITQAPAKGELSSLKPGTPFTFVRFVNETQPQVLVDGKVRTLNDEDPDGLQFKTAKEPQAESWALITLPDGTQGWALDANLDWKPCPERHAADAPAATGKDADKADDATPKPAHTHGEG